MEFVELTKICSTLQTQQTLFRLAAQEGFSVSLMRSASTVPNSLSIDAYVLVSVVAFGNFNDEKYIISTGGCQVQSNNGVLAVKLILPGNCAKISASC